MLLHDSKLSCLIPEDLAAYRICYDYYISNNTGLQYFTS